MADTSGVPQFQVGLALSDYVGDEESASICPLLTPSPSEGKLICTSPDFSSDGKMLTASPVFMKDPESVSMCPLLESSPPPDCFRHPLDPLGVLTYDQNSGATELSSYVNLDQSRDSRSSSLPRSTDMTQMKRGSSGSNMRDSSSSSSSALQENPAMVQLLTNHNYQQINTDKIQENGRNPCIDIGGKMNPAEYSFVSWDWSLIRKSCFSSVVTLTLVCVCAVIAMIATVPETCYPYHKWYQGSVFYEIFPASFQDSGHDGLGDLQGVASRTEYFRKLGVSAIRLNSIFPAKVYPEEYDEIQNLTSIDHRLGTVKDLKYLLTALHSSNISLVIDLPIYPLVKNLGDLKKGKTNGPIRKDNIAEKITNTVHNHRSHREVHNETEGTPARLLAGEKQEFAEKKSMLNPYIDGGISGLMKATSEYHKTIFRTAVEEALNHWFGLGVDGVYIKGLENYLYDPHLLAELKHWHKIKESYSGSKPKLLMTNYDVFEQCDETVIKNQMLLTFDLLDVYLEVSNGTQYIADEVNRYLKAAPFNEESYSWFHWNIGNVETPRLSSRVKSNLGAILFQSLLPGTISIFYGDEIALTGSIDTHKDRFDLQHLYQLSPMKWIEGDSIPFTPNVIIPWLHYGSCENDPVTARHIINNITNLRRVAPSVYMKVIIKEGKTLLNTALRYRDDTMISMERYYPRRNTFVVFYNTDIRDVTDFDISKVYFGGNIIQDSEGNSGDYVSFKKFSLPAGQSFIVKFER